MNKLRKIIALTIVAVTLIGVPALPALARAPDSIYVSLRIEGAEKCMYFNDSVKLGEEATIADLMAEIKKDKDAPEIKADDTWYITEIGGLAQGAFGGYSGWLFHHNGYDLTSGISEVLLYDGDEVVCFYGDPFGGPGMQFPEIDVTRLVSEGVIRFTSSDTTYDEQWTPTVTENPVEGATVTFNGNEFITDENGEIKIPTADVISGCLPLQIEKYDAEVKIPTVLRYEPGYEIYVPFKDVPEDAWYEGAVAYCVGAGLFIGTNPAQNTFGTLSKMTMAQLVTLLPRIAGVTVDSSSNPYYASSLEWAVENGIITKNDFEAGAYVSRELFIYLFYRTADVADTFDMEARAEISGAKDYDDISEAYKEAVSWAVASGIIVGTSGEELTISPKFEINRVTACQMLLNYFTYAD